jgi:hypothetical protein
VCAYRWIHRAAHVLGNADGAPAAVVRGRFDGLIGAMCRHRGKAGALGPAVDHFHKVARSYRPDLFHCYAVADLPRTNNDLEQLFGSARYHERRATGRKTAAPAAVLRGSVRLVAGMTTRISPPTARDLARVDRQRWREVRQTLDRRRHSRTLQSRFRRDPEAYLSALESQAKQLTLPS